MRLARISLAAACMLAVTTTAYSAAVISSTDGIGHTVYLGVNDLGHLNVSPGVSVNTSIVNGTNTTGIAYADATTGGPRDATSPGCLCEGWGVSATSAAVPLGASGYANIASGISGLTLVSFASAASTATSITQVSGFGTGLTVEQAYSPAVAGALFKDHVKITNTTGATVNDVKYVRVMDWDVPYTEFSEFVSIQGVAGNLIPASGGKLEYSSDQGFASADPLAANPGGILGGTVNTDFNDSGPSDHGAYFRFNFGSLLNGASVEFDVFYGTAPNEVSMLASLFSQAVNLYTLGQSSPPSGDPTLGTPITYAFGFKGVGEVVAGIPEPTMIVVWGGLAMIAGGAFARRSYRKQA